MNLNELRQDVEQAKQGYEARISEAMIVGYTMSQAKAVTADNKARLDAARLELVKGELEFYIATCRDRFASPYELTVADDLVALLTRVFGEDEEVEK